MAVLEKLIVSDFRNIHFAELSFAGGFNCICGDNGQGKTNLLDAIYYLSMTKSAFASSDRFCFRHGCQSFSISGMYAMPDGMHSRFVITTSSDGTKTLRRDDKAIQRVSSHIGALPIVMVAPQDSALVSEGGEERRRFVNAVLSQLSPAYLAAVQKYNRFLSQRNRLLKDYRPDMQLLAALDAGLSAQSLPIFRERFDFASRLEERVAHYYAILSGGREKVGISYSSDLLDDSSPDPKPLEALLEQSRQKDLLLKYTSAGLQRDDFVFTMDGQPIRKCGSQGQQKCFLVALKFAQMDIMKSSYGYPPVLLLDDVFDKLDTDRITNLLTIVGGGEFGQIFISDTNRARLENITGGIAPDAAFFDALDGEFH